MQFPEHPTPAPAVAAPHSPAWERLVAALSAFISVLMLVACMPYFSHSISITLPVLASMGASAFLLFVMPHSPMAQPWPVAGGHLVSASIGVACALWLRNPMLAAATAVGLSIFAMHGLRCLHPPSAATALIAVLGGPEIHALAWRFAFEVVAINVGLLLLMALLINNIIPGRRYPMLHAHHPHHAQASQRQQTLETAPDEEDFKWALAQMDAMIDISPEDLVDLYEFAAEHAQARAKPDSH